MHGAVSSRTRGFCYDVDVVLEKTSGSGTYTACESGTAGWGLRAGAPGRALWPRGGRQDGEPPAGAQGRWGHQGAGD